MAPIHAFLVITLRASQIVSGLALTIFAGAAGLSSYLGNDLNLADNPARHAVPRDLSRERAALADRRPDRLRPERARLRVVGVRRRRLALSLTDATRAERARGRRVAGGRRRDGDQTSPRTATRTRSPAARFAGVAGATFTLAITPQWVSGITGGAGWIAIALVIFAFWRPALCLVGAYFFGALQALSPQLQAREIRLGPTELWTNALPYVMTVLVLALVSSSGARRRLGAPASLGLPYVREER